MFIKLTPGRNGNKTDRSQQALKREKSFKLKKAKISWSKFIVYIISNLSIFNLNQMLHFFELILILSLLAHNFK